MTACTTLGKSYHNGLDAADYKLAEQSDNDFLVAVATFSKDVKVHRALQRLVLGYSFSSSRMWKTTRSDIELAISRPEYADQVAYIWYFIRENQLDSGDLGKDLRTTLLNGSEEQLVQMQSLTKLKCAPNMDPEIKEIVIRHVVLNQETTKGYISPNSVHKSVHKPVH